MNYMPDTAETTVRTGSLEVAEGGALSMRYREGERDIRVSAPGASGFR
jgi:hypothetical protein